MFMFFTVALHPMIRLNKITVPKVFQQILSAVAMENKMNLIMGPTIFLLQKILSNKSHLTTILGIKLKRIGEMCSEFWLNKSPNILSKYIWAKKRVENWCKCAIAVLHSLVSLKIEFQIHCTAKNKVCSSEGNKLEITWYENTCNF